MQLLDGVLGNLLGSVLGGGGQPSQNPLGAVLGRLGGGNQTQSAGLLSAAMALVQQHGGLSGVLDKFRNNGLAQHADSWVSKEPNLPVSGEQVQQVFGQSALGEVASKLGLSHGQAGSAMAQILPELVNQLTPEGRLPDNHQSLISKGLELLGARGS